MLSHFVKSITIAALIITFGLTTKVTGAENLPDLPAEGKTIDKTQTEAGDEQVYAVESTYRSEHLYPTNYGQIGTFRVRSAESLPDGALTFGIGGEFYSVTDAPEFTTLTTGGNAKTIAESIFVGYSPVKQLTLGIMRRSSSTTFGNPPQLISSLGDLNFTGMYSFPLNESMAVAPIANVLIASNFNSLAPAGETLSAGVGAAFTFSMYPQFNLPLFLHANLIYHAPQIRGGDPILVEPETFFNFSRRHTIQLALAAEYKIGDFIPFMEIIDTIHAGSQISFGRNPSKIGVGTRFTPLSNKSLSFLLGMDLGLGRAFSNDVPYSPAYQVIGQVSYTVGLSQTERKHYYTTADVNVVDRKFVIRKNINFKIGSAELEQESTKLLDQIAEVIKENKVKRLLIVGHTDSSHNEDYNLKLSLARAETVKRYLGKRGIPEESLMAQGYGKRKPRASNATESGRALNRRVEFLIVE